MSRVAITFAIAALFAAQMAQAQGTLYVSNLGQNSAGSFGIGNNMWLAQGFETGASSGGYVLNSVQVEMAAAIGNPSGFVVSLYSSFNGSPSDNLGALGGSINPSSPGLYTYNASPLTLAPSTEYFIVATDATPTTQGIYTWVDTVSTYSSIDEWSFQTVYGSANGSDWTGLRAYAFETAIYATAVPEPPPWVLGLLGGGFAFYLRARKHSMSRVAITFAIAALFAAQMAQAQGTLYVSNIGQGSFANPGVSSISWVAQLFETGNDSGGYVLNSVQLGIGTASGTPSGFNVSIYSDVNFTPDQNLGNLTGSTGPFSAGLYTYSASGMALAPSTEYFIVASAATPTTQGYFVLTGAPAGGTEGLDQWLIQTSIASSDSGLDWIHGRPFAVEAAIYATAIPEPPPWVLGLLGGGFAFYLRARKQPKQA